MDLAPTNNVTLVIASTTAVLTLAIGIAWIVGRRARSSEDWLVGGRDLPFFVVVGTQYASAMGGGILVGLVGVGYTSGWSALTYGVLLGVAFLFFIAVAPWLRQQNFTTLPDIFERFYGNNKALRAGAAMACVVVPFGWVATQLVAFGKLLQPLTGLPLSVLMSGIGIVGLLLVMPAGLSSVAWTDFVFGVLMLGMSVLSLGYALDLGGGWRNIAAQVPAENIAFPEGMLTVGAPVILLWALALIPGSISNQLYYQRIYAIRNPARVRSSLFASVFVLMLSIAWAAVMGLCLRAAKPGLAAEAAAGWFLTQVPTWFVAMYTGFIAATVVSTVDSALQSAAVNISKDIYHRLINPAASDRRVLNLSRVVSAVLMLAAIVWAVAWPEALGWLVASYAYSASALLWPLVVGLARRNRTSLPPVAALTSMVCGIVGCAAGQVFELGVPYVLCGLVASLVGLVIATWVAALPRSVSASHAADMTP